MLTVNLRGEILYKYDNQWYVVHGIKGNPFIERTVFDTKTRRLVDEVKAIPAELYGLIELIVKRYELSV